MDGKIRREPKHYREQSLLRDHLISRGMNPSLYKIQYGEGVVTFYLYNGDKLVGYQQYNPNQTNKKCNHPRDSRYYTYLPKEVDGLFGLEQDSGAGPIFVVEGIFKAAKLHRLGYNAVACLGANPKRLRSLFKIWKATRRVIAIGDPDKAGAQLVSLVGSGAISPADLDEMLDSDVVKFVVDLLA